MKFLGSPLGLVLLGLILNAATTAGLLLAHPEAFRPPEASTSTVGKRFPEEKPAPKPWNFHPPEVDTLIKELKTERENLATREKELVQGRSQLTAEQEELKKTREEIQGMREEIAKHLVQIEEGELKNLKSLATTYANIAPAAMVAIFKEMDETLTVKLLSLMKPDKVASVLGEMARTRGTDGEDTMAKRAARVSDKLRLITQPAKKS